MLVSLFGIVAYVGKDSHIEPSPAPRSLKQRLADRFQFWSTPGQDGPCRQFRIRGLIEGSWERERQGSTRFELTWGRLDIRF